MKKLRLRDRTLELDFPMVMGILNVTPDSFSDGGRYFSCEDAFKAANRLQNDGADIVDIGAQSTRPGYTRIGPDEEWGRISQLMSIITTTLSVPISVDTFYPEVAEKALGLGAHIINDVTGFGDGRMREVAAKHGCGCIIMHSEDISDKRDPVERVREFFEKRVEECLRDGIKRSSICLDVGVGFGKTREQELELIRCMGQTRVMGLPILAALSRKRVIAAMTGKSSAELPPDKRDPATALADTAAILAGADIIRVHNVKSGRQTVMAAASIRDGVLYGERGVMN